MHSLYVGQAAGRIASELGLNDDYARAIGYMHDIGRCKDHRDHVIAGYKYLVSLGYKDIARYCLTHSFVNNKLANAAGGVPKNYEYYDFLNEYLNNNAPNIYDKIVQLCDLFCLESGYTTFEKRILDITRRKGVYENSYNHFKAVMELRDEIESVMGKKIYDIFDIRKEDLASVEEDYKELMKLFGIDVKS